MKQLTSADFQAAQIDSYRLVVDMLNDTERIIDIHTIGSTHYTITTTRIISLTREPGTRRSVQLNTSRAKGSYALEKYKFEIHQHVFLPFIILLGVFMVAMTSMVIQQLLNLQASSSLQGVQDLLLVGLLPLVLSVLATRYLYQHNHYIKATQPETDNTSYFHHPDFSSLQRLHDSIIYHQDRLPLYRQQESGEYPSPTASIPATGTIDHIRLFEVINLLITITDLPTIAKIRLFKPELHELRSRLLQLKIVTHYHTIIRQIDAWLTFIGAYESEEVLDETQCKRLNTDIESWKKVLLVLLEHDTDE